MAINQRNKKNNDVQYSSQDLERYRYLINNKSDYIVHSGKCPVCKSGTITGEDFNKSNRQYNFTSESMDDTYTDKRETGEKNYFFIETGNDGTKYFTCLECHNVIKADLVDLLCLENGLILPNRNVYIDNKPISETDKIITSADILNYKLDKDLLNGSVIDTKATKLPLERANFFNHYFYYLYCFKNSKKHEILSKIADVMNISLDLLENDQYLLGYNSETRELIIPINDFTFDTISINSPDLITSDLLLKNELFKRKGSFYTGYFDNSKYIWNNEVLIHNKPYPKVIYITDNIFFALWLKSKTKNDVISVSSTNFLKILKNYNLENIYFIPFLFDNNELRKQTIRFIQNKMSNKNTYILDIPFSTFLDDDNKEQSNFLLETLGAFQVLKLNESYFQETFNKIDNNYLALYQKEILEQQKQVKNDIPYISKFIDKFYSFEDDGKERIKTGFTKLDDVLDGGLTDGMYIIGAKAGTGKSAFISQISDYIALNGTPVIYFSLEMKKDLVMSRSLARESVKILVTKYMKSLKEIEKEEKEKKIGERKPILTSTFLEARKRTNLNDRQKELYIESVEKYSKLQNSLIILDSVDSTNNSNSCKLDTLEWIKNTIENYINLLDIKPVVIIDYLQYICLSEEKETSAIKQTVKTLKDLVNIHEIPLILISSLNRESKEQEINHNSFMGSSAIEFTADVLLGLSLDADEYTQNSDPAKYGLSQDTKVNKNLVKEQVTQDKANKSDIKAMCLHIIKNRSSINNIKIKYDFLAKYMYFEEKQ